jgi:hypothetical protein
MKLFRYQLIAILFFIFSNSATSYSQIFSDSAKISLLTCNPGKELYSVFGHSAIRVYDPERNIDWVYNYGTFTFDQPGFYVKFVRGYLNYQLSVYRMSDFMNEYREENRSVFEQVLDLNQEEKEKIFKFIEFNRLPENKYYLYNFFFDNCATRIRDVFQNELINKLKFSPANYSAKTFRQMLEPNLEPHPWSRFGINLVLGAIADRKATLDESMFLPDYMNIAFENAKITNQDGEKLIVKSSNTLFEQNPTESEAAFLKGPGYVFTGLFIVIFILTYFEMRNGKYYKLIDFVIFLLFGIIGMILFLLWTASDHTAVVKNWNLLWAFPGHLFLAFFVFRKSKSTFLKYYFLITGLFAFAVLPLWGVIPQRFDLAFIPLILIVSLRSYQMFRFNR